MAGCGKVPSSRQAASETLSVDPALALVQRFHMGAGLESLANDLAHSTTTYAMLVQQHGLIGADRLLKAEISMALPEYQSRWDRNLAAIYSKHFTAEELRSFAALGKGSPYVDKFNATHDAVGAEMRAASKPLLLQLTTESLLGAARK